MHQVNFKNETNLASMQIFSKIKVTITVLHMQQKRNNVCISTYIEHFRLLSFSYSRIDVLKLLPYET